MKYQTIEGEPLTREGFKNYIREILQYVAENENTFYGKLFYDLRIKCEMTLEEFTGVIHEIKMDDLENR